MGFTLLETLVVIAIIGLAAVVAIPYFVRSSRRQQLVGAAHEIQQSLLAARMRAVRANQNTSLVIIPAIPATAADHELDTVAPDNSPAPLPTPVLRTFLPASALQFVALPASNKVTFGGDGRVIAPPAPTPGVITVQGPVGSTLLNQVTIQANSTGRIQVVTPAVWQ
jgi:prepilin-type N-terminal cleavage/methylation domain-containing protein